MSHKEGWLWGHEVVDRPKNGSIKADEVTPFSFNPVFILRPLSHVASMPVEEVVNDLGAACRRLDLMDGGPRDLDPLKNAIAINFTDRKLEAKWIAKDDAFMEVVQKVTEPSGDYRISQARFFAGPQDAWGFRETTRINGVRKVQTLGQFPD